MSIDVLHGKDLHGQVLQEGVKNRLEQADAVIGFTTLRAGQEQAEMNTHVWVRDELVHAIALGKPTVEVRELGVKIPPALMGDRQRIQLDPADKLLCVKELISAVSAWNMRRFILVTNQPKQARQVKQALTKGALVIKYRARIKGADSKPKDGRKAADSFVEVEGSTRQDGVIFNTGWAAADLVRLEF